MLDPGGVALRVGALKRELSGLRMAGSEKKRGRGKEADEQVPLIGDLAH